MGEDSTGRSGRRPRHPVAAACAGGVDGRGRIARARIVVGRLRRMPPGSARHLLPPRHASMSSPPILPSRILLWVVFAAASVLMFANLGSRDLMHPDEGRYGEIAREMVASGDWVTPRLNGLKYFEKPPFQYWVTAAAFRAFGVHEWTTRLWPAAAGWLAVLAVGIAGRALGGPALGTFAALALAGMLWPAALAQAATLDSGLAFFLAVAFAGFVIAQQPGTGAVATAGVDVGDVGRDGRRDAVEGSHRHRATRRCARRLHVHDPRFRGLAQAPFRLRAGPLPRADRALVRRGVERERRIPVVLLRPRASAALSDRGASARGLLVLLPSARGRRAACRGSAMLADGAPRAWREGASDRRGSRGSAWRWSGRRSCCCSSVPRARSFRRTSCRCSRRWRSSPVRCC